MASRESSDFYVDVRITALSPKGINLISKIFLDEIASDKEIKAVGCVLSVGACSIVGATVLRSYNSENAEDSPLRGFIVRKEKKEHGTKKAVEGEPIDGCKVVMVEDVINTGGSVLTAIEQAEAEGAEVDRVLCVIDRGKDTEKTFKEKGYKFFSIFKLSELL